MRAVSVPVCVVGVNAPGSLGKGVFAVVAGSSALCGKIGGEVVHVEGNSGIGEADELAVCRYLLVVICAETVEILLAHPVVLVLPHLMRDHRAVVKRHSAGEIVVVECVEDRAGRAVVVGIEVAAVERDAVNEFEVCRNGILRLRRVEPAVGKDRQPCVVDACIVAVDEKCRRVVVQAVGAEGFKAVCDVVVPGRSRSAEDLYSRFGEAHRADVVEIAPREGMEEKTGLCLAVSGKVYPGYLTV